MRRTEGQKKQEKKQGFYVKQLTKAAAMTVNLGEVNCASCPDGTRQCFVNYMYAMLANANGPYRLLRPGKKVRKG